MRNKQKRNNTLNYSIYQKIDISLETIFPIFLFFYFLQQQKYLNNNADDIYFNKLYPLHDLLSPWFATILSVCIPYTHISSISMKSSNSIPHLFGTYSMYVVCSENVAVCLSCVAICLWIPPHQKPQGGNSKSKGQRPTTEIEKYLIDISIK